MPAGSWHCRLGALGRQSLAATAAHSDGEPWRWTMVTVGAVALPVLVVGIILGPSLGQLLLIVGVALACWKFQHHGAVHLLTLAAAVFVLAVFGATNASIAFATGVLLGITAVAFQHRRRSRPAQNRSPAGHFASAA